MPLHRGLRETLLRDALLASLDALATSEAALTHPLPGDLFATFAAAVA